MEDRFNRNQLLALCTTALFAPALRLFPAASAALAGRASWLSPLAALPVLLLYTFFLWRFMARRLPGEGLPELALRLLGAKAGRAVLLALAAWLLLYAGFSLRAGAERFVATIYAKSTPEVFILSMGALCFFAALGPSRSLARMAKLVLPVLLGVLGLIFLAALRQLDRSNLLPLTLRDTPQLLLGALPVVDLLVLPLLVSCFFRGETGREPGEGRALGLWVLLLGLLLLLLGLAVIGRFGAPLTARLSKPFFTLVRNLVFFRSLERMEALVVNLWVFPDFLLVSLLLHAAQHCLRLCLEEDPAWHGERRFSMERGRWVIPLCGATAILIALFLGRDTRTFSLWSERIIPGLNLAVAFLLLPGVALWAKRARKKGL